MADDGNSVTPEARQRRRDELLAFFMLTLVIAPAVTIGIVGFYGLCIWLYQAINGPPGPPLG